MSEDEQEEKEPGFLDRLVESLAGVLNSLGLNGTRLLWKWRQKRHQLAEKGLRSEIMIRSAKGRHKMCRSCRALVDRSAGACPECGESLHSVRAPGVHRLLTNLIPGVTAATSLVMLVNGFWFVIMILAQIKSGGAPGGGLFGGFDLEMLVRFGAGLSRPRMLSNGMVVGGEWWRMVTPIFLHAGLLHFAFNSFLLIQLGPIVEEIYGTSRYWVIYLACGIAGCMTSELPRFVITVGASGAIMGLIGLLIVYGYRRGGTILGQNMKSLLFRLIVYSFVLSVFFSIDHLNHIGGFACGALLALIVPDRDYRNQGEATAWQLLALAGVLVVLLAFYQVAAQGRALAAA